MSIAGKSLMVLTPMYGGVSTCNYFTSFIQLVVTLLRYKMTFSYNFIFNESLIPRARNRLVDHFLKTSSMTHCLFIDADIGFEPMDVLAMLETDLDIIGAPCVKKSLRWDRVQQAIRSNPDREFTTDELSKIAGDFVLNFEPFPGVREMRLAEPQEMRNLGTGMMMIKREVLLKIKRDNPDEWYESPGDSASLPGPIFDYFYSGVNRESREYESEDFGFCMLAKRSGFKIWLCPWIKTTHMGTYTFVGDVTALSRAGQELR
jgi:hypothetical protein